MSVYTKFYNFIGFNKYIEVRVFGKHNYPVSYFASNIGELKTILNTNKKYNCYFGVNPRKNKGRKNIDVNYRRCLIFDVEAINEKKPLTDEIYKKELNTTITFIEQYLKEKYNLKMGAIVISGRGIHLYYFLNPLHTDYQPKYIRFYNDIIKYVNNNSPFKNKIKIDPPVKDLPRIFGCPATQNIKYDEPSAFREIIYFKPINNDLNIILDEMKEYKPMINKANITKKYTNETIFNAAEFKVFEHNPMKGTSINNKLRLALRLLMVECNITNHNEVSSRIYKLGYEYKDMTFNKNEYKEYVYDEQILNKYIIDNWYWSIKSAFKIPYKLKEEKYLPIYRMVVSDDNINDRIVENNSINSYTELVTYIKYFNNKYSKKKKDVEFVYYNALKYNIKRRCSNEFYAFIELNNLILRLKCIK